MANEWVLHGVRENDPHRICTPEALIRYINEVGFLPLFRCGIPGLSVEERAVPYHWWCGDERVDPWEWRRILAASGEVAYGKFFDKKAGFVSKAWLPDFANLRRDGYDFDSLWDEGKASFRQKKIMDCFADGQEQFSFAAKRMAGFGKDGEKNFEGTVTDLQMQTYLVIRDFRQKCNKKGQPYGWHIAVYTMPETIWGYALLSAAYAQEPEQSALRIRQHFRDVYPIATDAQIRSLI